MSIFNRIIIFISPLWMKPRDIYYSIRRGEAKKIFREQILRTQDSNLKMATAIGFGIFMGIFPIWGLQMLVAVFLAAFFRLNKAIVLLAASISIPPVIPFLLYLSFLTGGMLLNQRLNIEFNTQFDFENIQNDLFQYYIGAGFFASIAGLFSGVLSYILLFIFRKELKTKMPSQN